MNLYSLTLQQTTGIQKCIPGKFSNSSTQEIIVSKVKHLELLRWNDQANKLQTVITSEVFGLIRDLQIFRLPGSNRDHIILGTDAGRVVILQYDGEKNQFIKIHQETYGKTGARRIVPGQFLACDPRGRAFMISACEKNKFVYILNRENERVTVSSPLEAPKSHTIVFDIIGLDAGYDNALFAALEVDYGDWQDKDSIINSGEITKFLTIYEMDFGLNTVKRRTSDPINQSAHQLLMVPFVPDGPGGVLCLCEDVLIYRGGRNIELTVPFPKRLGGPGDRGILMGAVAYHKQKGKFLYIIQSELGDLFELQFNFTHEDVHSITLQYFDTIPVASSLCFMRQGYLFASCDRGNHQLYQIISLGRDEQNPVITDSTMKSNDITYFTPRKLLHLKLFDEIRNYSCITQLHVADLINEGNPQIYTLCAAGSRSTLRILRHGLGVTQLANTNLPGKPLAVWTIKQNQADEFHKYIILSFLNQTVVLSISQVVTEAKDSGLENQRQSLHVGLLDDSSIIQVLSNGFRHIRNGQQVSVVNLEGKILKACSNTRQMALGMADCDLYYYELDKNGQMVEISKERMEHQITAIELGPIEEGRIRSTLMAIGQSDNTVRIVSLEPDSYLDKLSILALPSIAESLCMMNMSSIEFGNYQQQIGGTQLFLFLGLNNGVLMRSSIDQLSGQISDTRTRYLSTKQVKCFRVMANSQPGMLALSSRPWLCYNHNQRIYTQPLSYDNLDYAASFNTKLFVGGIVGISGNTLRIIAPDKYGELFNETIVPLTYSPRKMVIQEESKQMIIIESDNRAYTYNERNQKRQDLSESYMQVEGQQQQVYDVPETQCTLFAPVYKWAACVRILDTRTLNTVQLYEFQNNEHAVSISLLKFSGYDEQYLCIGTVKDLQNDPVRKFTEGLIHTFILSNNEITLLHTTQLDEVPYALSPWRGRLLVGAGTHLRVYEMGKKRLLKKAELKNLNSFVTQIHVHHDRIFITLSSDSVHLLRYRIKEQTFMEIADDILPRWVTASCLLDYHTIIAADKFENFYVSRVPMDIDMEQEEHPFEFKMKMDQGCMNGAPFKMDLVCNYYYGELITTLQKAALVSTANEVIVFGTSLGSIGALFPFESKEDIDFFLHLEMYLRVEAVPISGRDHMMFRSFYGPCKAVVDGDLCEEYSQLPYSKQKQMSEEFDRTPADILKKLEDVRNKIL